MYVYCVYPAMSSSPKQRTHCLKRAETSVVLILFHGFLFKVYAHTATVSYSRSSTRHSISWSATVYNKNVSRQYNLTAQTEPVQAKSIYCYKDGQI